MSTLSLPRLTAVCLLLFITFSRSSFSSGGHVVGTGGDAVFCYEGEEKKVLKSIEVLDYHEARVFKLPLPPGLVNSTLETEKLYLKIIAPLEQFSKYRYQKYKNFYSYFEKNREPLTNVDLSDIKDSQHVAKEKNCDIIQAITALSLPYPTQNKFLVSSSIWNHPKMTNLHRAGLILHEAIYQEALQSGQTQNSRASRYLNALIFSREIFKNGIDGFQQTLKKLNFPPDKKVTPTIEILSRKAPQHLFPMHIEAKVQYNDTLFPAQLPRQIKWRFSMGEEFFIMPWMAISSSFKRNGLNSLSTMRTLHIENWKNFIQSLGLDFKVNHPICIQAEIMNRLGEISQSKPFCFDYHCENQKEFVRNGDFSDLNKGFFSEYTLSSPPRPGEFDITTDSQNSLNYWLPVVGESLSGGHFMRVTTSGSSEKKIFWEQTVRVTPHCPYTFSLFATPISYQNIPRLQVRVKNIEKSTFFDLKSASQPGVWQPFEYFLNSENQNFLTLSLESHLVDGKGGHFVVDDIQLSVTQE